VSSPFSSSACCCHCTVVSPLLSHHETQPRSPFELPNTVPSSTQTPGAPSTSLPVHSAAPLLHHRRSSLLGLHRCGTPLISATKPGRYPAGLLSGHSTATHRPSAGRISLACHRCQRGRRPPLFHLRPKGSVGWAGKTVAKWAWPIPRVPFLFSELIQNSIQI
jgi:hypothetical protein